MVFFLLERMKYANLLLCGSTRVLGRRHEPNTAGKMDGGDVCAYLDANKIEAEITAAVAACVEQGAAQPLAYLAQRLAERAAEVALDFDYKSLCAELKALVRSHECAAELVRLSWHDAGTYSVVLGGGGPNAAMRFQEGGEG